MDGSSFGQGIVNAVVVFGIICAIGGAVVGITLVYLVPWIWHHVSIVIH